MADRRQFLQTTSTVTAATIVGVGLNATVAASEGVSIDFDHDPGRVTIDESSDPARHAHNMGVSVSNIDLSTHMFEIERVDTNQRIQLEFSTEETIDPDSDYMGFRIYDAEGTIRQPPTASIRAFQDETVADGAIQSGDEDIFSSGSVFGTYRIHILQNGERIASTEQKAHGVGYPANYEEHRANGEVTVSIPTVEEINSSWDIEYKIENQIQTDSGFDVVTLHESEMQIEGDQLVTTYSIDELEPVPDDATHVRWIQFDDNETLGRNLSIGGHFFEDELHQASETDDSGGAIATVFSAENGAAGNPLLVGSGGVATIGAGYLAYKKLQDDDESSTEPMPTSSSSDDSVSPSKSSTPQFSIDQYNELNLGDTVKQYPTTEIRQATTGGHTVWVLTPTSENETVETSQLKQFSDEVAPWANMDEHEHVLSVYGHGDEPLPWVAVEPADSPSVQNKSDDLTSEKIVAVMSQACEAVHHVQRYGLAYEQLSPDSVIMKDGTATLRGVFDQLAADGSSYELPAGEEDPKSEQADVYRLSALTYEVLTDKLPEHLDPTPPSSLDASLPSALDEVLTTALAEDPEDRYETVLHLRDELRDCIESA